MPNLSAKLGSGFRHHKSGNFTAAEKIYRHVLDIQPDNHEALYLMGTLAQQTGRIVLPARHKFKAAIMHGHLRIGPVQLLIQLKYSWTSGSQVPRDRCRGFS